MAIRTGKCFVDAPGFGRFNSKPGATMSVGGVTRESVESDVTAGDFTEKLVEGTVELTVIHDSNLDLVALGQIVDANISFSTDTGQSYLFSNAYVAEPPSMSGGDVSVSFRSRPAKRVS